ncbi:CcdC protein domain-containing protein [Clostridium thermobutyricum]|uniref:CcdC protein domain-containing protein n=1 Tax=Clostridium thermobutyricum TaxID=29372 RepID=UPI0018AA2FA7|nr:CcdC protein domain-containing protein [Clostridium thermobutyricum]
MQSGIVIIVILYLMIKSSLKGKTKKIKDGFFILPLIFLYLSYTEIIKVNLNLECIGVIIISLIIGGIIGLFRSRFYKVNINDLGEVVYKRQVFDILVLVVYLLIKVIISYAVGIYDRNFLNYINVAFILTATASIGARRVIIYYNYLKLKGKC